ncbi:MAG: hypothetical protein VKJ04_08845 [Vampirovibrionales bacterium]|nr:hypothetical protein [Vampirovibrionales bacterium]
MPQPAKDWRQLGEDALYQEMQRILRFSHDELFYRLSNLRDFVNQAFPTLEFYQEDLWNERILGETHLDSILRCKKSLYETEPFAYDVYKNHQDAYGVWHLDDYQKTVLLMSDTRPLVSFIFAHTL